MKRIICATCETLRNLTEDDQALIRPLADRGIEASAGVWSDASFPWRSADAVLIRSCWDYHRRTREFLEWIKSLEKVDVRVWNSPNVIRWNTDKAYLRDLEAKGVPVIPTLWPDRSVQLRETLQHLGWQKAVIKPRISASAYLTRVTSTEDANEAQPLFEDLLRGPGVMVQQFMVNVLTQGEWSLMFFGGEYSHAVIKTPKAGDFRVQHDHGGSERNAEPPAYVIEAAARAVQAVDTPPLYARVDGVESNGQLLLMELELIEPALFLKSAPGAAETFADSIAVAI
jgi:glutathione synthase/RimK-type ligase-like ATP-grasp enzyme